MRGVRRFGERRARDRRGKPLPRGLRGLGFGFIIPVVDHRARKMSNVYESDFYAWAMEQAALLRERRLDAADIDNIAEEIESMGRGEKRELVNRLTVPPAQVASSAGLPQSELELKHPRAAHPPSRPPEGQSEPQGQAR
jgi:hypothetical protein